jgi:hypothetical protein
VLRGRFFCSGGWLEPRSFVGYIAPMPAQRKEPDDLDSPWKEALEHFLESFLALCFPDVHAAIDWARGYQSLDKELQQIARDAAVRKRLADKLFKVWRKGGKEAWLLIHVEIQGQPEPEFVERMFVYTTGFVTGTIARS